MRLLIAGSRSFHACTISIIKRALVAAFKLWQLPPDVEITEVISGGAKGIDYLGEKWAQANKIPIKRFEADWDREGRSAGPKRNERMIRYALENQPAAVLVIHDGVSPGSANLIKLAKQNKSLLLFVGHPKEDQPCPTLPS